MQSPAVRRPSRWRWVTSVTTWRCWRCRRRWRARPWSRRANPGVRVSQAINVWIIQLVVAIGPLVGALIFEIYIKTDWGISLFFLTPLALVAIPALRVQRAALVRITAIWLVITLAVLAASPQIAVSTMRNAAGITYGSRSQLARELTEL